MPTRRRPLTRCNRFLQGAAVIVLIGARRATAEGSSVTVVGAYSNMVITDVHAQGYSVELWQDGSRYFGFLLTAAGLAADTPTGLLDDLRYDPTTRALTFKAKLSTGRSSSDGEHWFPSRDLFQFEGTLYPDQITGTLIHADALTPDRTGQAEEVKLYRVKDEETAMPQPATYAQWEEMARHVLEVRGPKW